MSYFTTVLSWSCLALASCSAFAPNSRVPARATPAPACVPNAFDAAAVERRTGPATLQIAAGQSVGSGFVIADGGGQLVVTNYHVVAAGTAQAARLILADGSARQAPLEVVMVSREADLALLRPSGSIEAPPLPLKSELPDVGEGVAVVGYPGVPGSAFVRTFEPGTITAAQRHVGTTNFIQTNANINPGNSGGPLVDGCGRVVGVVAARHATTERLGLVIPTEAVKQLLAEYHKPQLSPQRSAELQLQRLLTEVKFRRSEKAAFYFTRGFVEKHVGPALTTTTQSALAKVDVLIADMRKKHLTPEKVGDPALTQQLTARLNPLEIQALSLHNAVAQKRISPFDAAGQFWAGQAADLFGGLDDIWLENASLTAEGCVEAYVTAVGTSETRRYLLHMHHELGQWLIEFVNRMR